MNARLLLGLATALVLLGALLGACDRTTPPRFPHAVHLTGLAWGEPGQPKWLVCTTCHRGIKDTRERLYPDQALCDRCHATDGKGALPKEGPPTEASALARNVRFTHDKHLRPDMIGGQCTDCHKGIPDATGQAARFPAQKQCETCHAKDLELARCSVCHDPRGLATLVPRTFMRHDDGWMKRHGPSATQGAKVCSQCHSEATCKDCHDASQSIAVEVRRPDAITAGFIHRDDFKTRHAIEARSQPATCVRCHAPSTCDSCHVEHGVSGNAVGATSPHPRGWVGPDTGSPSFHGRAARRDIVSCAACHDRGPATNCILCHKVGGQGGNPHGRGYSSSRSPSAPMCRSCHGT
jgi:hypothetical protein